MGTATLVRAGLSQYCPKTNHYQCSDGTYLLVTVKDFCTSRDYLVSVNPAFGTLPISRVNAPSGTDVFLSDASAAVLDADGNPANGMTPLAALPNCSSFAEALAELGWELV